MGCENGHFNDGVHKKLADFLQSEAFQLASLEIRLRQSFERTSMGNVEVKIIQFSSRENKSDFYHFQDFI